jgi:hypothetical protein
MRCSDAAGVGRTRPQVGSLLRPWALGEVRGRTRRESVDGRPDRVEPGGKRPLGLALPPGRQHRMAKPPGEHVVRVPAFTGHFTFGLVEQLDCGLRWQPQGEGDQDGDRVPDRVTAGGQGEPDELAPGKVRDDAAAVGVQGPAPRTATSCTGPCRFDRPERQRAAGSVRPVLPRPARSGPTRWPGCQRERRPRSAS